MSASPTRRPLSDTLVELLEGLTPARAAAGGIRVERVAFALPLELRLAGSADAPLLLGNLRRWRWPTDFDDRLNRLSASFDLVES
jgi:hypothetical protein